MTVTREEFEDVKVLLGAAARASENANEAAERASMSADRANASADRAMAAVEALSRKLDEYIFQSQRLINQHGERLTIQEGRSERIEAVFAMQQRQMERLDQNHNVLQQMLATQQEQLNRQQDQITLQQQQIARQDETQRSANAALDQLGSILNQLLRRDQNQDGSDSA
jgi:chromosome segregation ATPase